MSSDTIILRALGDDAVLGKRDAPEAEATHHSSGSSHSSTSAADVTTSVPPSKKSKSTKERSIMQQAAKDVKALAKADVVRALTHLQSQNLLNVSGYLSKMSLNSLTLVANPVANLVMKYVEDRAAEIAPAINNPNYARLTALPMKDLQSIFKKIQASATDKIVRPSNKEDLAIFLVKQFTIDTLLTEYAAANPTPAASSSSSTSSAAKADAESDDSSTDSDSSDDDSSSSSEDDTPRAATSSVSETF